MRTLAIVVATVGFTWLALRTGQGEEDAAPTSEEQSTRLATLYRHDPLLRSLSLQTGRAGTVMHFDGVFNRQSDIEFGFPNPDDFSVGIEGRRDGVIVDLGTQDELAQRHDYRETLGGGQGFATMRMDGDRVIFRNRRLVKGSEPLFRPRTPDTSSAAVRVGHVYLVRLFDRADPAFERIVKLLVVGHQPGDSVTIRWAVLRDSAAR